MVAPSIDYVLDGLIFKDIRKDYCDDRDFGLSRELSKHP